MNALVLLMGLSVGISAAAAPTVSQSPTLWAEMTRRHNSLGAMSQQSPVIRDFAAELAAMRQRAHKSVSAGQIKKLERDFRAWERRLDAHLNVVTLISQRMVQGRAGHVTAEQAAAFNAPKLPARPSVAVARPLSMQALYFGDFADNSRQSAAPAQPTFAGRAMRPAQPVYNAPARSLTPDGIVVPLSQTAAVEDANPLARLRRALLRRWGARVSATIDALLVKGKSHGLDHFLIAAITDRESGGRYWVASNAKEPARGAMQVKPTTAREVGVYGDLYDPMTGVEAGVRRFKQMFRKFGDLTLALAHYYSGPNSKKPSIQYAHDVLRRAEDIRRATEA